MSAVGGKQVRRKHQIQQLTLATMAHNYPRVTTAQNHASVTRQDTVTLLRVLSSLVMSRKVSRDLIVFKLFQKCGDSFSFPLKLRGSFSLANSLTDH